MADVWKNFPLVALIALAALQSVPRETMAASIVDGAGPLARFRFVMLPYLAGPLMIALGAADHRSLQGLRHHLGHDPGGPANSTRTLSILVYQEAIFSFQRAGSGASHGADDHALVTLLAAGLRGASCGAPS